MIVIYTPECCITHWLSLVQYCSLSSELIDLSNYAPFPCKSQPLKIWGYDLTHYWWKWGVATAFGLCGFTQRPCEKIIHYQYYASTTATFIFSSEGKFHLHFMLCSLVVMESNGNKKIAFNFFIWFYGCLNSYVHLLSDPVHVSRWPFFHPDCPPTNTYFI